jgi:hypothetical protein
MVVNIFLTIADEVGVYDLLMLLAEAVIVVYLITKRSSYLSTNS